jgi:hypothetical protein
LIFCILKVKIVTLTQAQELNSKMQAQELNSKMQAQELNSIIVDNEYSPVASPGFFRKERSEATKLQGSALAKTTSFDASSDASREASREASRGVSSYESKNTCRLTLIFIMNCIVALLLVFLIAMNIAAFIKFTLLTSDLSSIPTTIANINNITADIQHIISKSGGAEQIIHTAARIEYITAYICKYIWHCV